MKLREINEEVLYADDPVVRIDKIVLEDLKDRAKQNKRKRVRICSHIDVDDIVHEMLIVHARDTYVRPHKHIGKSESFHIVEGTANVIIFTDKGGIRDIVGLGESTSEKNFYFRINQSYYHTLQIISEYLIFHETTSGPFNRSDTVFPTWAPQECEAEAVETFMQKLSNEIRQRSKLCSL